MGQMDGGHVAAAAQAAIRSQIGRIGGDHGNCAEPDDERQQIEVTDPAGRPQNRLARLFRVGNGEEAHQNVG